jgi:hypothetical protein
MAGGTPQIAPVVDRLVQLMDESGGWCFDTYDTRVGPLYLFLAQRRQHAAARYLLFGLYALELFAPLAYRRVRGIPKTWDPMGNSYRAGIELSLYRASGEPARLQRAREILDRVQQCAVGTPGQRGFALGFPCITGSNKLWRTDVPVAHYTLRVARKFLEWQAVAQDGRYDAILAENIEFLLQVLPWRTPDGSIGVAYTPEDPLHVINIWADVAAVLATYDRVIGAARCRDRVRGLLANVLSHQLPSGGWPYFARWETQSGPEDNTHTAMVLAALAEIAVCYPDLQPSILPALERGLAHWIDSFFDERTGRHWNLTDRPHDVFTVCFGDALYAFDKLTVPELGLSAASLARVRALESKLIRWSLDNLLLPDGRFCERKLRFKSYSLRSIRSFDGLIGDALAQYLVRA